MIRTSARSVRTLLIAILVTGLFGLSSCGKNEHSGDPAKQPKTEEGTLIAGGQVQGLLTRNAWCASKSNATLTMILTVRFTQDGTLLIETQKCEGQQGAPGLCTQLPNKNGTWNVATDGYLETQIENQSDRARVFLLSTPGELKKVRVKGDNGDFSDFSEC